MATLKLFSWLLGTAVLAASSLLAQQQQQQPSAPAAPAPQSQGSAAAPATPQGHGECWKQAGISKSTMRQRRAIIVSERRQIQGVRSDTSLTPQQQDAKIREIRDKAKSQLDSAITPEQRRTLGQCQHAKQARSHASLDGGGASSAAKTPAGAAGAYPPSSQPN